LSRSSCKVVLATSGTHGDLHPFIAVALGLREHGFDPVVATHRHFRDNVEEAGLRFHAIRPSQEQVEADLNMTRPQMLRAAKRRPQIILTKFFLPYLRQSYEDSLAVLADAGLVLTNTVAFGAKLAAERLRLPHLGVVLQPYTLLSAFDPPLVGNAQWLSRMAYRGGMLSTRAFLKVGRIVASTWARPIHQFRRQIGLPQTRLNPFFEGQYLGARPVGLYSKLLGDIQPDFPNRFVIAGFAFYDGQPRGRDADSGLESFLEQGPPPLTFTQGTSAVHDSERFARVAIEAVEQLKERAILVLDDELRVRLQPRISQNVLLTGYLPYSKIFGRSKAIIHHAGVGTMAQALRSGRPQLITPYFADQPDNAARVERLGIARVIPPGHWSAHRVAHELRSITMDTALAARAASVAQQIERERAVDTVVRIAVEALSGV
jgi:rhamnosyltransferase subunit B